ncbi:MAG: IS1595 family transposase [Candidatus Dadabacteria bacterium]|nr:IS1595 family transposase [Candidatus Dadabacteria bacterium]
MSDVTHKAPGRSHRKGIGFLELLDKMFPNEEAATKWFEEQRWPGGKRTCPHCGSIRTTEAKHKMPYHCKDCRKYFSVRTGTVMRSSGTPLRKWVIAMYLMTTNLKGVSSMKLHRDLGIAQSTAWALAQKIRQGWIEDMKFEGTVEADETFIGGKEKNKHEHKRSHVQGPGGKAVVVGIKNRETNKVVAKPVPDRSKEEIHGFIDEHVKEGAKIYSDDHRSYNGLSNHESVNHSVGEYVREQAHTNGVESFWATLKRGYNGTYHKMSPKHLERYVTEFAGRHNTRDLDTIEQMIFLAKGMVGKKLSYAELKG